MNKKEISNETIETVAKHINERNNRPSRIPISTTEGESETPHYFEIVPFDKIDKSEARFYAIDGSYNSQEFYNGLSIGIFTAGYICFHEGKQVCLNELGNPIILGKSYFPQNILITNEEHKEALYDELLELPSVRKLLNFFETDDIFSFNREIICISLSKLLSFAQEVLEWALVLEIADLQETKPGDFILRDGTLRSNNIKQVYLVKLAKYIKQKGAFLVSITKNSPIKIELSSTFKKIDGYLQDDLKPKYPFKSKNPKWKKLCCWLEVGDEILTFAYPEAGQKRDQQEGKIEIITKTSMYAKKTITGGRGTGIFFVARLDYVEKLQNYDWVVADLNIFDVIPNIENNDNRRDIDTLKHIFYELTRLTQEHYILGYPFPLVEAHNFVTLKNDFKDEIIKRVKYSLYRDQKMDNVDIENLFLDIHDRF